MKLVFLIGGAGFIGRHLIESLSLNNKVSKIVVIDTPEQIQSLLDHKKFVNIERIVEFIGMDLSEESLSKRFYEFQQTDSNHEFKNLQAFGEIDIFHLASPVGVENHKESTFYKAMAINQNVFMFAKCIQTSSGSNMYFWYTSTSEVYGEIDYGENKTRPQIRLDTFNKSVEEFSGFRADYIYQKVLGEQLFSQLNNYYSVRILRPFNLVGLYQDPTKGVFKKFIHAIVNNKPVTVNKDIRCYTKIQYFQEYVTKFLSRKSEGVVIDDIIAPWAFTSLTSEELYLYLHNHICKKYFKEPFPVNYKLEVKPSGEIQYRGIRETLSFSRFELEFGPTIEKIIYMDFGNLVNDAATK